MNKEYLLDGYNVIHATAELKRTINSFGMDRARADLIAAVASYMRRKRGECTIVFDGIVNDRAASPRVRILSSGNRTADQVIQERIRAQGKTLIVVTSDLEIIETARVNMAELISSGQFAQQLGMTGNAGEGDVTASTSKRIRGDGRPHRIDELKEQSEKPNMMSDGEMDEWKRLFGVDD